MSPTFQVGDWRVEPDSHRIVRDQEVRDIEPRHMRILVYLLNHPGKQIPDSILLQQGYRNKNASEDSLHIAVKHLREALGDSDKRARYIKQVPGKGYILVAKVADPTEPPRKSGLIWKLVPAAVLVAVVVFLLQRQKFTDEIAVETPIRSLTMQPLEDHSHTEATGRLAKAVDANIRARLSRLPGLKVVAYPEEDTAFTPDRAEELGVEALVRGWITVDAEKQVTLSAGIYRLHPQRELFSRTVSGRLENIQHMQQRLARDLSAFLHAPGTQGREGDEPLPEAYEAFIEGHALLTDRQYEAAVIHFENARTLSPDFAEPYLGLALAKIKLTQANPLLLQKELDGLIELLERAIALKPELSEAYTALGTLHFFYTWKFAEAEANFLTALEKNPNDPEAHHRYAMFCVAFGRFDAAVEHINLVRKLAPYTYAHTDVAFMFNIMGNYEEAERELILFENKAPNSPELISAILKLRENQGKENDAFMCYEALLQYRGYSDADLDAAREAFQSGGLAAVSRWLAFVKFEERDIGQYEAPLAVARYLAGTHEKKLAFDWLEKALAVKQTPLLWLNVDPKYDALRADPRFGRLIERIGLDYTSTGDL